MHESAFLTTAVAITVGVLAQGIAARLAVPGIVLLLAAGIAVGPDGLGWVDPGVFGAAQSDLVSLAVTIILFEGAIGIDLDRLREHRRVLLGLLAAGAVTSMVVGTVAVRALLGLPWSVALLYGSLMIVTGPTVVTPLVARLPLRRSVRELLVSEGVLVDPLGAIVALVVAEVVIGQLGALESGYLVVLRLGTGAAIGVAVGLGLAKVLRREVLPEHLSNALVLATALLAAAAASGLSPEAGLMAAVAQGVTLANQRVPGIGRLRAFKETLTVVLLGFVFVVLTAGVRLTAIVGLGLPGLAVVAALVWVGRPPAVLLATAGSAFTWGERGMIAWICPRGIVAASVAGLFRFLLDEQGLSGGAELEALVFLTVAVTVTWQGVTAGPAARLLHTEASAGVGTVIVGADELGRLLARTLADRGRQVVLIDLSPWACDVARREGLTVYEGDALSLEVLEEAGVRHADTLVALTRNRELNALVARRTTENFKVERVLAFTPDSGEPGDRVEAPFSGDFPGVDQANAMLRRRQLALRDGPVSPQWVGVPLGRIEYPPGEFALAVVRGAAVVVARADLRLAADDAILSLRPVTGDPVPDSPRPRTS